MIDRNGYFGIGIYRGKTVDNLGTLWRSAHNFGAAFIFTIGGRYDRQATDTTHAAMSIPLQQFPDFEAFHAAIPHSCPVVGVEQSETSVDVATFNHPQRAIYLLGAEDNGLPRSIAQRCHYVVHISTPSCLNVAVAGSIVMYARSVWKKA
jgi:tRNA G18 (ribose-2'-O)-methylase SpoU